MGAPDVTVPISLFLGKELTVKGSFRYGAGDYPLAISLVSSGKIDVKPLITHRFVDIPLFMLSMLSDLFCYLRFSFKDAVAAFETSKTGKGPDGKGVIKAVVDGPED